ncbi:hypothetical protein L596_015391 [Steinernema carpocapsae]|uniref:Uncharacterized protein n=1 Tax=Steinernema carpocapsae TaxID=34508 RepID=A0A4U5NEU1_STECR|nr:hypothetical protein L596_015391 [Steinernema carpocapsae]
MVRLFRLISLKSAFLDNCRLVCSKVCPQLALRSVVETGVVGRNGSNLDECVGFHCRHLSSEHRGCRETRPALGRNREACPEPPCSSEEHRKRLHRATSRRKGPGTRQGEMRRHRDGAEVLGERLAADHLRVEERRRTLKGNRRRYRAACFGSNFLFCRRGPLVHGHLGRQADGSGENIRPRNCSRESGY